MSKQLPIVALIYDFDGTLAPGNMQEYDFLKEIGISDKNSFWKDNSALSEQQDASEILSYMKLMIDKSNNPENPRPITRNTFRKYGNNIKLFKGVKEWFDLTKKIGEEMGVQIEHYINSSGLQEMIEGTPIGKHFKHIYASRFMYDKDGKAVWPAVAVDFTGKTQYLYMINKGVESVCSNKKINAHMSDDNKRIPFAHMIYFGDGETDIPCMKLLRQQGGYAIAIYEANNKKQVDNAVDLVNRNIINFACDADYSEGGNIYKTVKTILQHIKMLDGYKRAIDDFDNLQMQNHDNTKRVKQETEKSVIEKKKPTRPQQPMLESGITRPKFYHGRFNPNETLLWLLLNGEL
ncbi:haloacid dehalogenase-like hydrolase [bacterium]|nr:haloacid dehalogenase-like hydrolase [bacterium]